MNLKTYEDRLDMRSSDYNAAVFKKRIRDLKTEISLSVVRYIVNRGQLEELKPKR